MAFAFAPQSILAALEGIQVCSRSSFFETRFLSQQSLFISVSPSSTQFLDDTHYLFARALSLFVPSDDTQFVTNVLFGKFVLGSHITNSMYAGTAIIIVGVVLTVSPPPLYSFFCIMEQ